MLGNIIETFETNFFSSFLWNPIDIQTSEWGATLRSMRSARIQRCGLSSLSLSHGRIAEAMRKTELYSRTILWTLPAPILIYLSGRVGLDKLGAEMVRACISK